LKKILVTTSVGCTWDGRKRDGRKWDGHKSESEEWHTNVHTHPTKSQFPIKTPKKF